MTSTMPEPQIPVTPSSRGRQLEAGLVRPQLGADDPEPRLEGRPVDPHALDRAGRRPLAAADLGALEGRAGRARGGEQPVAVAEDDLGVRADVDDEGRPGRPVRRLGQDDAGRVRADVAGDARQDVDAGAGVGLIPSSAAVVRTARSVASANGAEPSGIGSMPSRRWCMIGLPTTASSRISRGGDAGLVGQPGDELGQRAADGPGHLAGALGMHHRVRDPAHEVLAEADLRVHHAARGEDRAVGEVGQVAGDRRRADVDRDAEGPVVEAGPDAGQPRPSWTATVTL